MKTVMSVFSISLVALLFVLGNHWNDSTPKVCLEPVKEEANHNCHA